MKTFIQQEFETHHFRPQFLIVSQTLKKPPKTTFFGPSQKPPKSTIFDHNIIHRALIIQKVIKV